mgnify:CR=1 FL=1
MSTSKFPSRSEVHATQTEYPWHAVVRTVFQALVGFAAMWALIVEALGINESWPWVAASLAVTGAITRVMAIPAVNAWLGRYVPWLAAEGHDKPKPSSSTDTDAVGPLTDSE